MHDLLLMQELECLEDFLAPAFDYFKAQCLNFLQVPNTIIKVKKADGAFVTYSLMLPAVISSDTTISSSCYDCTVLFEF